MKSYYEKLLKEEWRTKRSREKETTYAHWPCTISKVSGSKKGSRRSRMDSYEQKMNVINLVHNTFLTEEFNLTILKNSLLQDACCGLHKDP